MTERDYRMKTVNMRIDAKKTYHAAYLLGSFAELVSGLVDDLGLLLDAGKENPEIHIKQVEAFAWELNAMADAAYNAALNVSCASEDIYKQTEALLQELCYEPEDV